MPKLVALVEVKGLFSGIVYANKYDEVELTIERIGVSQYRNLRTGELIDAANEKIGYMQSIGGKDVVIETVKSKKLTPKQLQQIELYNQMMKNK